MTQWPGVPSTEFPGHRDAHYKEGQIVGYRFYASAVYFPCDRSIQIKHALSVSYPMQCMYVCVCVCLQDKRQIKPACKC